MSSRRTTRLAALNPRFDKLSGLYLWAIFIVVFGIWKPDVFFTGSVLHSVASEQAVGAMLAIAILVPLAAGAFDLSVGAITNLSAIVAIWLQSSHHWAMWPAIAVAVLVSALVGFVNGFVVVVLRVSSFIATLAMSSILAAVLTIISGATQPLPPTSSAWTDLTQRDVFGFQIVFVYLIVIAILFWWFLDFTPAGRYLYAVGGNAEASRLSGIRVGKWTWTSLVVSASLAGVAGVFYGSQFGPSLTFGAGLLLPAFAAAFLGSTQLQPGRYNVWGTLIAVYVLATGVEGLQLVTGVQWLNQMFSGVALIVAVAFAIWRQGKVNESRRQGQVLLQGRADLEQDVPDEAAAPVP